MIAFELSTAFAMADACPLRVSAAHPTAHTLLFGSGERTDGAAS
jgi:hypothetical protein